MISKFFFVFLVRKNAQKKKVDKTYTKKNVLLLKPKMATGNNETWFYL